MAVTARYSKKIQVNLDENTNEEVTRLSDEQGVSKAEIIRRALEAGLPHVRDQASSDAPIR